MDCMDLCLYTEGEEYMADLSFTKQQLKLEEVTPTQKFGQAICGGIEWGGSMEIDRS